MSIRCTTLIKTTKNSLKYRKIGKTKLFIWFFKTDSHKSNKLPKKQSVWLIFDLHGIAKKVTFLIYTVICRTCFLCKLEDRCILTQTK